MLEEVEEELEVLMLEEVEVELEVLMLEEVDEVELEKLNLEEVDEVELAEEVVEVINVVLGVVVTADSRFAPHAGKYATPFDTALLSQHPLCCRERHDNGEGTDDGDGLLDTTEALVLDTNDVLEGGEMLDEVELLGVLGAYPIVFVFLYISRT
ncbi:hypothetical protein MRB53_041893 [Persea americana]|nr:hypothetical protein MRB53_041893 [Persea americana]